MPTVPYLRPAIGFRPQTNPLAALAGLRLRGLGDGAICLDQNQNSIPCSSPDCTFGDCGSSTPQIMSGSLCLDQSQNQVPCNSPECTYGDCVPSTPAPSSSSGAPSASPAGVPTGTYLSYTGHWQTTVTKSSNDLIQAVISALAAQGLQVTNFNTTAGLLAATKFIGFAEAGQDFNVTIQLLVNGPGFAKASDAASIVDHAFYVASGKMPLSSSVVVQSLPGSSGGTSSAAPPPPIGSQSFVSWIENNAGWIGIAVVAIAVLPTLTRKLL